MSTITQTRTTTDPSPDAESDLPEGWVLARLGDGIVVDVHPGFACGVNNRERRGIGHLRPMNVNTDGQIDLADLKYVPESECDRDERLVHKGDVLFNNTNSTELVGKTACYGYPEARAFSNHVTRLQCRPETLDPRFCAIALHHRWREGYFQSVCNQHVSQSSVNRTVLLETEIALPPLPEQVRIVAKIEELFKQVNASRDRLAKVPKILKRFRQSVLAAACSGRLTEDWRKNNPQGDRVKKLLADVLSRRKHRIEESGLGRYHEPCQPDTTFLSEVPEE